MFIKGRSNANEQMGGFVGSGVSDESAGWSGGNRQRRRPDRFMSRGLAEATVNRRLATVRSLLKLAHRLGFASSDDRGLVDTERVTNYRDTRGIDVKQIKRLLALPDTRTLASKRDRALLLLLWENALRRAEVCSLLVGDFEPGERRLSILGKGRGTQREPITISCRLVGALSAYLLAAGHSEGALFRNLVRDEQQRTALTGDGLYEIVAGYGQRLGLKLTPHKLRYSAITAALDATKGDVWRLSRPRDVRVLQRYDDNQDDLQGEVTTLLSKLA
jgi:integrase/recombinase XerC